MPKGSNCALNHEYTVEFISGCQTELLLYVCANDICNTFITVILFKYTPLVNSV